jgi:hypothetical protein
VSHALLKACVTLLLLPAGGVLVLPAGRPGSHMSCGWHDVAALWRKERDGELS